MSLINRGELRSSMRAWVAASEEMRGLEAAMKVLYPKGKRPSVRSMAEVVLFSVLHTHENQTHGVLPRFNNAMARLLDDLEALRAGKDIEGRTAGMHANDLATIAKALDDLATIEAKIKMMLDTDPTGSWVDQLKIELATSMSSGGSKTPMPRAIHLPKPASFEEGTKALTSAIANAALTPHGIWNQRKLPSSIRQAAHNLVVAAGGDVAITIRRILDRSGANADAMVIAVLWAEKKIAPGAELSQIPDHAVHQTSTTGLGFEWTGQAADGSLGKTVGLDGIAGGMVVDAKHSAVPLEQLPHLTGELPPAKAPIEASVDLPAHTQMQLADKTRPVASEEKALMQAQHKYLEQMRRQLDFARENGLRGINWVCNDAQLADGFRLLSTQLPSGYKNMQINFTVGGIR